MHYEKKILNNFFEFFLLEFSNNIPLLCSSTKKDEIFLHIMKWIRGKFLHEKKLIKQNNNKRKFEKIYNFCPYSVQSMLR